jgi:hypothetical protein
VESTNRDDTVDDKILAKSEALELVSQKLETMTTPDEPFVIFDSHTLEKPYGRVFFYNSEEICGNRLLATHTRRQWTGHRQQRRRYHSLLRLQPPYSGLGFRI